MSAKNRVGYIGLGVMGEPMCTHLINKSRDAGIGEVYAFDLNPEPLARVAAIGAKIAQSPRELCEAVDVVMFCLPDGEKVRTLVSGSGDLLASVRANQLILDLGTTPVPLTRKLHDAFAQRDAQFADCPVTRTRQAARDGTLSTLVGGSSQDFARAEPLLRCFSSDVTYCGPIGAGQVIKQMNNMVLFQTVAAIAEALTTCRAAGVDDAVLYDALTKGSGDSFALRNHGKNAMLPGKFPERAFSTQYALKDLRYAIELANSSGLELSGAANVERLMLKAIGNGDGDKYFPVIIDSIT